MWNPPACTPAPAPFPWCPGNHHLLLASEIWTLPQVCLEEVVQSVPGQSGGISGRVRAAWGALCSPPHSGSAEKTPTAVVKEK